MPSKLHRLKFQRQPFKAVFKIEGEEPETVTGHWNPAVYTPLFVSELTAMDNKDPITLARLLSPLLVDWDLVFTPEDEEAKLCKRTDIGKMCPTSVEFLSGMPIEFLSGLSSSIQKEAKIDPNSGSPSGDSSFQEDDEGPLLTNT